MTRRSAVTITVPPRAGVSITLPVSGGGHIEKPYSITLAGDTLATLRWRAQVQTAVDPIWGEPTWTTEFFPLDDLPAAISWVGARIIAGKTT